MTPYGHFFRNVEADVIDIVIESHGYDNAATSDEQGGCVTTFRVGISIFRVVRWALSYCNSSDTSKALLPKETRFYVAKTRAGG